MTLTVVHLLAAAAIGSCLTISALALAGLILLRLADRDRGRQ